jgi:hypothetical protein
VCTECQSEPKRRREDWSGAEWNGMDGLFLKVKFIIKLYDSVNSRQIHITSMHIWIHCDYNNQNINWPP